MRYIIFWLIFTSLIVKAEPLFMDRIEDCPKLPPRPAPTSVTDLRPDDIKVVGAMGDSVIAGATSLGVGHTGFFHRNTFIEARGITYAAGGDPGAVTIPNFLKHYSPNLKGGSVSEHLLEYCYNGVCDISQYIPDIDQLNGAQSAATSHNMIVEIEYIARRMKTIPGLDYEKDWKLLNLQIGGLDQCLACDLERSESSSPDVYSKNIEVVLEYVRNNIPRTVVNLIGVFNVSTIFPLTIRNPYCKASFFGMFQTNMIECYCAMNPDNIEPLNNLAVAYSNKLRDLHLKYKASQTDGFGVIFTPANINFTSYPVEYFSNLDCYHPSIIGHGNLAKTFWRPLFVPLEERPAMLGPADGEKVFCPESGKKAAATRAVKDILLQKPSVLGLGSGTTIVYALEELKKSSDIVFIPTSFQTRQLILQNKLKLGTLEQFPQVDITIDGADEIDPQINAIKGGGACLFQEKLVAHASRQLVLIADETKKSLQLGTKWKRGVPVEVLPMAAVHVQVSLKKKFPTAIIKLRMANPLDKAGPVVTDNGNFILDCHFGPIENPARLYEKLKCITGVLDAGLFCNMANQAYIGHEVLCK